MPWPIRIQLMLLLLTPAVLSASATAVTPVPASASASVPAAEPAPLASSVPVVPLPAVEPVEEAPGAPSVAAEPGLIEATRSLARSTAEWLARGVDSWFGNRPFEDGGRVSDGRLSVGVFKRQDQRTDVDVRFNAHFHLPNIEHQAYLFIGRDNPRDVVRDKPATQMLQQQLLEARRTDPSFLAGLGLTLRKKFDFRIGLGAHAKPYAQVRYDLPWAFAPGHLLDVRETVFWTNADRFGSTTVLTYDFGASPTLTLRWLNVGTITQDSENVEWASTLGAYKALGGQRLLSFEALFSGTGTQGLGVGESDRGLLLKYEQPIYKTWLLGEVVVGHFWPRKDAISERGQAWALGGSLKMRF